MSSFLTAHQHIMWISMLAVLVTVPTVVQNVLHTLSTSSIIARRVLDFMVQGKITEADAQTPPHLDYWCLHLHPPPIFTPSALSAATLLFWLGTGTNKAGLHSQWISYTQCLCTTWQNIKTQKLHLFTQILFPTLRDFSHSFDFFKLVVLRLILMLTCGSLNFIISGIHCWQRGRP